MTTPSGEYNNWGDYFWPDDIDGCLKNILDIHDQDQLNVQERIYTFGRLLDGGLDRIPQTFDLAHYQAIHHHLFQDLYEWAGQFRRTEMAKPGTDAEGDEQLSEFMPDSQIAEQLEMVLTVTAQPDRLATATPAEAVEQMTRCLNGINIVHPFRDGNGRTNRAFVQQLAGAAGLELDLSKFADQDQAMLASFMGQQDQLQHVIGQALTRRPQTPPDRQVTTDEAAEARDIHTTALAGIEQPPTTTQREPPAIATRVPNPTTDPTRGTRPAR